MPAFNIADAQAAVNFLVGQTTHIEAEVNRTVYPDIQYPGLIPVDTSAGEWAKTVTFFSADMVGAAKWINGNSDDVPKASTERTKFESNIYMAGIGYGYGLDELMQAQRAGINLPAEDAVAARRAYEEFTDRVMLVGDLDKGLYGLINSPNVTPGSATTGNWQNGTTTPLQIVADLNNALAGQYAGTLFTSIADTLVLPYERWLYISTTPINTMTTETILNWFIRNNVYTAATGRALTIKTLRGMLTAGAGGTARMVAYRRSPEVLKAHVPMAHRFLPVWQAGPLRWEVPGIFRLGGVDVRRPKEVAYVDGI